VNGRRKSKRVSDVARREYASAMALLEANFCGEERDYCCAADDFRRHPPLACDLMGSPREVGRRAAYTSRTPIYSSVQAASSGR